ncbi:MAG TPA: DNA-formamidopyrimidine glycosylase family protein, partial [Paracoccaceae bacterium]|nr:DNA-formamidopyrimidine glycosylase family protein [Paracoccaceae bacterium]
MPELPEVETIRLGLQPVMEGQSFRAVEARRTDLRWPLPPRFAERLTGAMVTRLGRRSKYLLAELSTGETLLMHLGMSGRLLVSHGPRPSPSPPGEALPPLAEGGRSPIGNFALPQSSPEKHDHVIFTMSGGARISFNDARRFGCMDLAPTADIPRHRLLAGL